MDIYLAGIDNGSIQEHIKDMKIYLAGSAPRFPGEPDLKGKLTMEVYLVESGEAYKAYTEPAGLLKEKIFILESFYYIKDWMIPYIKDYWNFMLDSGAYTFMKNADKAVEWDDYTRRYAEFVKEHDIDLFFEMDIDSVVGLEKVEELRSILEGITGKQSIPVWHRSRGKQYFIDCCKQYQYVAVGGIAGIGAGGSAIWKKYANWFCDTAHKHGAKIHFLGFTVSSLEKYRMDSVDSTAWIYGNRGGFLYQFTKGKLIKIKAPSGMKLRPREAAVHNFKQWVRYQKYMVNL